jgi:hypothetical protein
MRNKDKRTIVLSMVIGDGCLGVYKTEYNKTARLTIDHGIQQADYQAWKAKMLSFIFEKDVRVRTGHKGQSVQLMVRNKKLRVWHKFTYPNGRKSIPAILKWITNPEMALAIWLMDDGYCEPSYSKLADGSKKNYGARFRLFTNSQTQQEVEQIKTWLDNNFGLNVMIKHHLDSKTKERYPIIKFNNADTLKVWGLLREFILQFKSMKYKFRYAEQIYQARNVQRVPVING